MTMNRRSGSGPADTRQQRLQERQAQRAEVRRQVDAEHRRRRVMWIGLAVAAVVIAAGVIGWIVSHQPPAVGRSTATQAGSHVAEGSAINYPSYPPTSGAHYPAPAPWGTSESALPEGRFVHNLEHGGIVILYKCPADQSACSSLKQQLQDVFKQLPAEKQFREVKAVSSPYDRMDHQIAVLAWGWIDELDQVNADEITRFYQAHVDHGPEAVA